MNAVFTADFVKFKTETDAAAAKVRVFEGETQKAATALVKMEASTGHLVAPVNDLRGALGQVDGVLASVGINIGTEVRALGELSDAAGKTFTELGGLATAGLAVGTAMAAFSLTSTILEFTGLDKAIGDATVKLWDFGRAEQVAGAQQDVVTRAIERGADASISYTDALKFNDDWLAKLQGGLKQTAEDAKQLAAETKQLTTDQQAAAKATAEWAALMADLDTIGAGWQATLDTMSGDVVESIKFYLEAGASQTLLAQAFGVTAEQVKAVSQALRDQEAETEDVIAATTAATEATAVYDSGLKFTAETIETVLVPAIDEEAAALRRVADIQLGLVTGFHDAAGNDVTSVRNDVTRANFEALGFGYLESWLRQGYSLQEALAISRGGPAKPPMGPRMPGFREGGPVLADGPIFAHAGEFVIPKGGGGGSVTIANHFYGSTNELVEKVKAVIMREAFTRRQFGAA
jgi:transposase-like protein